MSKYTLYYVPLNNSDPHGQVSSYSRNHSNGVWRYAATSADMSGIWGLYIDIQAGQDRVVLEDGTQIVTAAWATSDLHEVLAKWDKPRQAVSFLAQTDTAIVSTDVYNNVPIQGTVAQAPGDGSTFWIGEFGAVSRVFPGGVPSEYTSGMAHFNGTSIETTGGVFASDTDLHGWYAESFGYYNEYPFDSHIDTVSADTPIRFNVYLGVNKVWFADHYTFGHGHCLFYFNGSYYTFAQCLLLEMQWFTTIYFGDNTFRGLQCIVKLGDAPLSTDGSLAGAGKVIKIFTYDDTLGLTGTIFSTETSCRGYTTGCCMIPFEWENGLVLATNLATIYWREVEPPQYEGVPLPSSHQHGSPPFDLFYMDRHDNFIPMGRLDPTGAPGENQAYGLGAMLHEPTNTIYHFMWTFYADQTDERYMQDSGIMFYNSDATMNIYKLTSFDIASDSFTWEFVSRHTFPHDYLVWHPPITYDEQAFYFRTSYQPKIYRAPLDGSAWQEEDADVAAYDGVFVRVERPSSSGDVQMVG